MVNSKILYCCKNNKGIYFTQKNISKYKKKITSRLSGRTIDCYSSKTEGNNITNDLVHEKWRSWSD